MKVEILRDKFELGRRAASDGAAAIRSAIGSHGSANIIVATGASQFEVLDSLIAEKGIDWSKVCVFHLDEYVGLPAAHPASFRRFLRERFLARLPTKVAEVHEVNGEGDPHAECARLKNIIGARRIDVAFVGIGENGHLAFNDPPADFQTGEPYIVVELDEACRLQQVGEGWYGGLSDVPTRAISMSVRQILKSRRIICSVPDARKAKAVQGAIEGKVDPMVPASIMQTHDGTTIYLDPPAASLLKKAAAG